MTEGVVVELESELAVQIQAIAPTVAAALYAGLNEFLERAIARFGRWIAEPLAVQHDAIESERQKLRALEELRGRLGQHEARLAWLIDAASMASAGVSSSQR